MSNDSTPSLPTANYFAVSITNNTAKSGGGLENSKLFLSLVSQARAYKFIKHKNSNNKKVYLATTDTPTGGTVASIPLSDLINQIEDSLGFYVQVFDGSPIEFTGGRLYFAAEADAVPYSSGAPGGISPDAGFDFDFIEFTVDSTTNQLNLDTTQVDQFGMPIYLQVDPAVPDFANGTGIVQNLTREGYEGSTSAVDGGIIGAFKNYCSGSTSPFTAYQGVAPAAAPAVQRLLAPQHVIDAASGDQSAAGLRAAFDEALYRLFNRYCSSTGGGGQTLYLTGNGNNGFEIFAGTVITDFEMEDNTGTRTTYTVFQFTGTGYEYLGSDSTLSPVGSGGKAVYQIYYPYFSDNDSNTFNTALTSASKAPFWFGGFPKASTEYNLPITSAGRMVFGASGCFADNSSQNAYYQTKAEMPANFDPVMLGNLENQLATMLNRGVAPDTGNTCHPVNLHPRTGSNTNYDLIFVDLAKTQTKTTDPLQGTLAGAQISYHPASLQPGPGQAPVWTSLSGTIHFYDKTKAEYVEIQTFKADRSNVTTSFTLTAVASAANKVDSANFGFGGDGQVNAIQFVWESAVDLNGSNPPQVRFTFDSGQKTEEAHYATLRLFTPYDQTKTYTFATGDLGPGSKFSSGLTGAVSAKKPTTGMTISSIGLSNPTYVYQADASQPDSIVIYSPQALPQGINTSILTFSTFYPVDTANAPVGGWNAYAAFFHIGNPASAYPPPTVDGKGYAFAYDDNGGYSSDITVTLPDSQPDKPAVATVLELTLLPWWAPWTHGFESERG